MLRKEGKFLTHLWALLSNAGINNHKRAMEKAATDHAQVGAGQPEDLAESRETRWVLRRRRRPNHRVTGPEWVN